MFIPNPLKGRGAVTQPPGRFDSRLVEPVDDGWGTLEEIVAESMPTQLFAEKSKTVINRNASPDLWFEQSINPYRGCAHGCIYCYARPAHAFMDLSPGLDFETKLFYKPEAARILEEELRKPGYVCKPIHIGGNTDPYQPIERDLKITRGLLEVLLRFKHPFSIISKGAALMMRDLDLYERLSEMNLVRIAVSVTSLDDALKRTLEPRTSSAATRLKLIRQLAGVGAPVTVMVAPIIPFVNDSEIEAILTAAAAAGATSAGYVTLRLPHEVKGVFRAWLESRMPEKAGHVMSLVRQMQGGRDYNPAWGTRQRGSGPYAELLSQRFSVACKRLKLNQRERTPLDLSRFSPPARQGDQLELL
jgi:DNA repair photolyase